MLKLSETFQIRGDGNLNYELYELKTVITKKTKEPKKQWVLKGCYGKIDHVLWSALNKYLLNIASSDEVVSCKDLLTRLQDIAADLKNIKLIAEEDKNKNE